MYRLKYFKLLIDDFQFNGLSGNCKNFEPPFTMKKVTA